MTKGQFEASIKEKCIEAIKEYFSKNELLKNTGSEEKYSTMKEVTEHFHVSKPTIYAWIEKELVFPYKFGGRVLFKIKEIEGIMSSPLTKNKFGNGRDYNYRKALLSQEDKDFGRFKSLNGYRTFGGQPPTEEDIIFYKKYCNDNNKTDILSNHLPLRQS